MFAGALFGALLALKLDTAAALAAAAAVLAIVSTLAHVFSIKGGEWTLPSS